MTSSPAPIRKLFPVPAIALRRFSMKPCTRACLAGVALLAACSSDTGSGSVAPPSAGRGAPGSEENLVQSVGDRIFFDTDSNNVNAHAQATLGRQATLLRQYLQVSVWVAGNCDERGPKSTIWLSVSVVPTRTETTSWPMVSPRTGSKRSAMANLDRSIPLPHRRPGRRTETQSPREIEREQEGAAAAAPVRPALL